MIVGIAVERIVRSRATRNIARKLATKVNQNFRLLGWYRPLGPGGPSGAAGPGGPGGKVGLDLAVSVNEDASPKVDNCDEGSFFAVSVDARQSLALSFSASTGSSSVIPLFLRDLSYRSTLVRLLASDAVDRDIFADDMRFFVWQEEQLLQLQEQAGLGISQQGTRMAREISQFRTDGSQQRGRQEQYTVTYRTKD